MLSPEEEARYDRQMRIEGWGEEGQIKLKKSKVVVAGVGGLGSPVALYLAAAGIGKIKLIDDEKVELSNLNRQILHWEEDIGKYKVDSAAEKLRRFNRKVEVLPDRSRISRESAPKLVEGFDVVVDALDNFEARFYLNEACVKENIPLVHGAVQGFEGRIATILPRVSPCLTCIYGRVKAPRTSFPVVGAAPAAVASLQAMEVIKLVTGIGKPAAGKLIILDGLTMEFEEIKVDRDPNCGVCGDKKP